MFRVAAAEPCSPRSRAFLEGRHAISRVIVGIGPGSYNGIRSAIAVAWGIATARAIPLVGVSSLLGLGEGSYCAVGDARREQYYFARVVGGKLSEQPELFRKPQLVAAVRAKLRPPDRRACPD